MIFMLLYKYVNLTVMNYNRNFCKKSRLFNMDNNSKKLFKLIYDGKAIVNSDPKEAYEITKKALKLAETLNEKSAMAHCFINFALVYRSVSNFSNWVVFSYRALDIFTELKEEEGTVIALNLLSCAYFHIGLYEDSLKTNLKVLDLCIDDKHSFIHTCCLNNLAEIYKVTTEYNKAFKYYEKALEKAKIFNYSSIYASILSNIGQVLIKENNYDKAMKTFTESYNIALKFNDFILLGEIENYIGLIYFKNKEFDKAMEYYNKALANLEKVSNKFYSIDLYINIAVLKLTTSCDDFTEYLNKAIDYGERLNCKPKLSKIYLRLSKYYESLGDFKTALEYYKQYHLMEEEVSSSVLSTKLEIIKIQCNHEMDAEKLEQIIVINQKLEMEIESQNKRLKYMKHENKDLRFKALKDSLTKISNRHAIDQMFNRLWKYPKLNKKNMVLFMIDVDNFKLYNDYWGHIKGDRCLSSIAQCLKEVAISRHDFCGRYGGEEFLYFSEDLTYEEALDLGNLIRLKVKNLNIKYTKNENTPIATISVGGAYGNLTTLMSTNNMIELADKELYISKESGKDTVTMINTLDNLLSKNTRKPMTINLC